MGVGREGQEARQQQNQEYADEQPDKAGHPHAEILIFPVVGAFRVGGEVPAGALEVGRLPFELLRGGAYQGLAAALERGRIVLRPCLRMGDCSTPCIRSATVSSACTSWASWGL